MPFFLQPYYILIWMRYLITMQRAGDDNDDINKVENAEETVAASVG